MAWILCVQDKDGNAVDMQVRSYDDDDSSFENNSTYDLGDDVMVESELQDDYSVEGRRPNADFDDDLDEDAGPDRHRRPSPPSRY